MLDFENKLITMKPTFDINSKKTVDNFNKNDSRFGLWLISQTDAGAVNMIRTIKDEKAQMLYEARQQAIMDENTRMHGMQRDIALNLLEMGLLTIEQIAQGTGLPVTEIESIKEISTAGRL